MIIPDISIQKVARPFLFHHYKFVKSCKQNGISGDFESKALLACPFVCSDRSKRRERLIFFGVKHSCFFHNKMIMRNGSCEDWIRRARSLCFVKLPTITQFLYTDKPVNTSVVLQVISSLGCVNPTLKSEFYR